MVRLATPVVLAAIIWLPTFAISSFWTQLIVVWIAIPFASVGASRVERLRRPDLVDHLRHSSLLYVSAIAIFPYTLNNTLIGFEAHRIMRASDYPRALLCLLVLGIVLNGAVLIAGRIEHTVMQRPAHQRFPQDNVTGLLLRWAVSPILLPAIVWFAMVAYSSSALSFGLVDLRTMVAVGLAMPAATFAAHRYEQLDRPRPIDHVRQVGLLYVCLLGALSEEPDLFVLFHRVWFEVPVY